MSNPASFAAPAALGPYGLAALGVQGAQALLQYRADRALARATHRAALQDYGQQIDALAQRSLETAAATTEQMSEVARRQRAEASRLATLAGEAGVGGLLTQRMQAASAGGAAEDINLLRQQSRFTQQQIAREREAARAQAQSIINRAPFPSLLGSLLGVAGSGLTIAAMRSR